MWEVLRFDMNFLYTMINLIVLAFLLKKFLIKPVTDIMEKRRQLIEDGLKNAQNAQEDAMKMFIIPPIRKRTPAISRCPLS